MAISTLPSPATDAVVTTPSGVSIALGWCLVTSGNAEVRDLLKRAARTGGWQTRVCRTPDEAVREAVLHRVPLALVDIGGVRDRVKHADLMRLVRDGSEGLVVVCDRSANADGELWARQAGAWIYLPGAGNPDSIASICRDARDILQKKFIDESVAPAT